MALHQLMAKVDEEAKGDSAGELGGSSLQGIAVTLVGEEGHEYCLDLSTGKSVVCTAITEGIIFFFFFFCSVPNSPVASVVVIILARSKAESFKG